MKLIFCLLVFSLFSIIPAFGQFLDRPGLIQDFTVEIDGYTFEVEITSNFDVQDVEFSSDDKKLTMYLSSGLENNLAEIQIPTNLINGNFTFFLNEQEIFPVVKMNQKISFITLEFDGDGRHKLEIIGTTYLPEFSEIAPLVLATSLIGILVLKRIRNLDFLDYSFNKD